MKHSKIYVLIAMAFISANNPGSNNTIPVQNKDTKLADWEWSSGDVELHKTASKQSFSIQFSPAVYHARDSVKIILMSYKVTMNNLTQGVDYDSWSGVVNLDYYLNSTWSPLVSDTDARINRPFTGKKGNNSVELKNYVIRTTVPLSHTLTLTTSSISFAMNNSNGNPIFRSEKIAVTFNTEIKGIEIEKIERGN